MRPNKRIDTQLSTPLFDLPLGAIPAGTGPTSLAQRNLLRHLTWPSLGHVPGQFHITDFLTFAGVGDKR